MNASSEGLSEVCRRTLVFIGASKFSQEYHVSVAVWRETGVRHKTSMVEYEKVHLSDAKCIKTWPSNAPCRHYRTAESVWMVLGGKRAGGTCVLVLRMAWNES